MRENNRNVTSVANMIIPSNLSTKSSKKNNGLVTPVLQSMNSESYLQRTNHPKLLKSTSMSLKVNNHVIFKETSALRKKLDDNLIGSLHAKMDILN